MGYYTCALPFSETQSAVVVLTNTATLSGAADWISQAVTEAIFDNAEPTAFVQWAAKSKENRLSKYEALAKNIESDKDPQNSSRLLHEYTGGYFNDLGNVCIDIAENSGGDSALLLSFQGHESQIYSLRHLRGDVFEWTLLHDEAAKRGRYSVFEPNYYKLVFQASDNEISSFEWVIGDSVPKGEFFQKT